MKTLSLVCGALIAPALAFAAPGPTRFDQSHEHTRPTTIHDPTRDPVDFTCNAGGDAALIVGLMALGVTRRRRR